MNEKTLIIGYDKGKLDNYSVIILISFGEYVIYKNYVKHFKTKAKVNEKTGKRFV